MSIFSKISRSHRAAKEHKGKKAKAKEAETTTPYKHIPTHAAVDALSAGPAGRNSDHKARIIEQNKRRSVLMATGLGGNVPPGFLHPPPTLPRVGSALSYASDPPTSSARATELPRSSSYNDLPSPWNDRTPNPSATPMNSCLKEKNVRTSLSWIDRSPENFGPSRAADRDVEASRLAAISALSSSAESSDSNGSQFDLEMRPITDSAKGRLKGSTDVPHDPQYLHPFRSGRVREVASSKPRRNSFKGEMPDILSVSGHGSGSGASTPRSKPEASLTARSSDTEEVHATPAMLLVIPPDSPRTYLPPVP